MLGTFLHHRIFYLFANDDMQMKTAYSDFAFLYFITQMNVNIYICVKMCMKRVKYFANTSIFNKVQYIIERMNVLNSDLLLHRNVTNEYKNEAFQYYF